MMDRMKVVEMSIIKTQANAAGVMSASRLPDPPVAYLNSWPNRVAICWLSIISALTAAWIWPLIRLLEPPNDSIAKHCFSTCIGSGASMQSADTMPGHSRCVNS